ncbi:myosin-14 [Cuculus canorus]|uniref:myosin-14 n=1 Tax=Cuculus canorus TaxID=55661 RepID=UPI0023AAECF7|nr:myosin-14 [Cuculus canorus]
MGDDDSGGQWDPPRVTQDRYRRELEEELRDLNNQVAALGRSLALERGRSLAAGGALRALEIAVGGAEARVGGACRARDRALERLRLQQEAGQQLWAELEAARTARTGAELRAQEAETRRRAKEAELQQLRQAVAAAQRSRRRAEEERDEFAARVCRDPHPPCRALPDPAGLRAALVELREHNRELQQRLQQRLSQAEELRRALAAAGTRAQDAARAQARLQEEQRVLRGRLQHPWVPTGPAEAALRARCLHLQELLHREAGARVALARAARVTGRRLRLMAAEAEEQRLRGERHRRQAEAVEASAVALGQRVAAVALGTAREEAQRQRLQRALDALGDGAAHTARRVAALRARLRCDPLTLTRTVRRMLREEEEDEDEDEDEDGDTVTPTWTLLEIPSGSGGDPKTTPKESCEKETLKEGDPKSSSCSGGSLETASSSGGEP